MRLIRQSAAFLPLVLLAACLNSTEPATVSVENTTFAPALGVDLASSTKTQSGLYYRDLVLGTGTTIAAGQTVGLYYTAYLSTGVGLDSLKAPATPVFTFKVGNFEVISGMDEGVRGMQVGGTRQLIIPPWLAYGAYDYGPVPGNSVLVVTVNPVSAQ